MSDGASLKASGTIEKNIQGMLKRSRQMQGWLNTVAYKTYQNAQRERWMTEGDSQGSKWLPVNPEYAKRKAVKFASAPGGGTKTLIASGTLQKSVIGPGAGFKKLTTTTSLTILTTLQYAKFVDDVRSFSTWVPSFKEDLAKKAMAYMARGKS